MTGNTNYHQNAKYRDEISRLCLESIHSLLQVRPRSSTAFESSAAAAIPKNFNLTRVQEQDLQAVKTFFDQTLAYLDELKKDKQKREVWKNLTLYNCSKKRMNYPRCIGCE